MPWLLGVAGLAVIAMIAYAFQSGSTAGSTSPTLAISNQMSTVLEVNPLMTLGTPAPAFTLTDQNGARTSLSAFTGKAVVLTFGDDKCTDLCTLLAEDVLAADKDLGSGASNIQFVSINANTFYPSVAATKSWTDSHGLGHTANWRFLTGKSATLAALAKRYGVEVDLHPKTRTIDHGTELFFISPNGDEEQIGDFGTESANTAEFSHSMAQLANELLPVNERHTVGGPTGTTSQQVDTAIGKTPPPIELPALGSNTATTLSADRGKYIAVNFWSPTCTLCVHELPAMEQVYRSEGAKVAVIGIDASDPGGAGVAFAARAGATYPMLSDAQGAIDAQYEIPGLPYTVILDPNGKVVVRHPGEMTAEQLVYILNTLTAEAPTGS
ncbi:MAG TPA: redoxin domain-containing protein [Galbitalea sp.]|jgi:cytochrome oxidase Cu insertion factor (SCO1/SenC/PrrC family)|nr:redoxin domain-containing protein [Galbitalea sp.]